MMADSSLLSLLHTYLLLFADISCPVNGGCLPSLMTYVPKEKRLKQNFERFGWADFCSLYVAPSI